VSDEERNSPMGEGLSEEEEDFMRELNNLFSGGGIREEPEAIKDGIYDTAKAEEAFIAMTDTLEKMSEMIGVFYDNLEKRGIPEDLRSTLVAMFYQNLMGGLRFGI